MGRRFKSAFVILLGKRTRGLGRLGITVSKTVGKAHVRNLVKRRIRHVIRENPSFIEHLDLVVIALPEAAKASFQQLKKDIERAYEGLRSRYRP